MLYSNLRCKEDCLSTLRNLFRMKIRATEVVTGTLYRQCPPKWSYIIEGFGQHNREKRTRDHFGARSFWAIILFFSFFFAQARSFCRSFWWSTFFVNKKWVFGYSVFSIFIESHWVGTRWWPRKFTGPGGTFTLNWCIASECYERDSVSNECLRKFE